MSGCAVAEKMSSLKVVALFVAVCVVGANSQYNNYNYDNYNNYPPNQYNNNYNYNTERPQDPILWRAHERTKFEAQLKVSCDTGDDRACFELFLSVHRMALYFTAAILLTLIVVGVCIGVCCYCRRKRSRPAFVWAERNGEEQMTLPMEKQHPIQTNIQMQPQPPSTTVQDPPTTFAKVEVAQVSATDQVLTTSRPRRPRRIDQFPARHSRSTVID